MDELFGRRYRFVAGQQGDVGFEVGEITPGKPYSLHIAFSVEKADTETPNEARITLWNLSQEQINILNQRDCVVALWAGYVGSMMLIFTGAVSFVVTNMDSGDRETKIEAVDSMIELRDTFESFSFSETVTTNVVCDAIANDMGVPVEYSHDVQHVELDKFSYVGSAKDALDKVCNSAGLCWRLQNNVLQISKPGGTLTNECYVLSADSGLIGKPSQIKIDTEASGELLGWEVIYMMNGAIGVNDLVKLESKAANGFFRVYSVEINGDNFGSNWQCIARLLEV